MDYQHKSGKKIRKNNIHSFIGVHLVLINQKPIGSANTDGFRELWTMSDLGMSQISQYYYYVSLNILLS